MITTPFASSLVIRSRRALRAPFVCHSLILRAFATARPVAALSRSRALENATDGLQRLFNASILKP